MIKALDWALSEDAEHSDLFGAMAWMDDGDRQADR